MPHPVNWFQIQGSNGKALQAFYKKVFGWRMQSMPDGGDGMLMVDADPGGIAGGVGASMDGSDKGVAVYIGVGDIDAHLGKISKAGGRPAMDKMELPAGMGFIAGFVDPAGNWIGLWQPGAAAAAPPQAKRAAKKPAPKKAVGKKKAAKKLAAKPARAAKPAKAKPAKRAAQRKPAAKGKKA